MSAATRSDVKRQKAIDRNWDGRQDTLAARMGAVLGAQEALVRREPNACYVLRQALIDLASISELVAEELPRPTSR